MRNQVSKILWSQKYAAEAGFALRYLYLQAPFAIAFLAYGLILDWLINLGLFPPFLYMQVKLLSLLIIIHAGRETQSTYCLISRP